MNKENKAINEQGPDLEPIFICVGFVEKYI